MNWVIAKSSKMPYHTYLDEVLAPFFDDLDKYQWLISDLDGGQTTGTPLNYEDDYFILSANDIRKVVAAKMQIYWGTILAIPLDKAVTIDTASVPFAEGNSAVFTEGNIQHPNAEIEIDCIDSSYTVVKFSRQDLSDRFKAYFDEALPLKKFADDNIKLPP